MLNTYADRVRFARSLTKLSRESFEQKYGINRNTLKSWELGVNSLTEKSAKLLSDAVNAEGFSCTPQWLIFGQGTAPRFITPEEDSLIENEIDQQAKILYEADYFNKNNHNSIVFMITDKSMTPDLNPGDYVGGINTNHFNNKNNYVGEKCIVTLRDGIIIVRKFMPAKNGHIVLYPSNLEYEADIVKYEDITHIARIIWQRTI